MRPTVKAKAFRALYASLDMRDAVVGGEQCLAPARMWRTLGGDTRDRSDLGSAGQNCSGSVRRAAVE
jgi:hypothetical protein